MTYFSRLTDIVTCNLTKLIEEADDPLAAIEEIIAEMKEGLAGASRSLQTAERNVERIRSEFDEHQKQISHWDSNARNALSQGNEAGARQHLIRKKEAEALVAGLDQQIKAAEGTREHLLTTLRALEARMQDAQRRHSEIKSNASPMIASDSVVPKADEQALSTTLSADVDAELEALKKELGG